MVPSLMLGNEAIALGLVEQGCRVVCAYPGTPSSEILASVRELRQRMNQDIYTEWSVNEKVAFEVALGASWSGLRSAVAMKQVGLNVASDPFFSAAYQGVKGGFIVISADDPGPSSSQTEQDSRMVGMTAKVPVLDPSTPEEARSFIAVAFALSERHQVPVLLRPTRMICHAVQDLQPNNTAIPKKPKVRFERNPGKWAATPRDRYRLHVDLNRKLEEIGNEFLVSPLNSNYAVEKAGEKRIGIIASGMVYHVARDVLKELNLDAGLLKLGTVFPMPKKLVADFIGDYDEVLVLEETDACIELQIPDRNKVRGRLDGTVPGAGELSPDVVTTVLQNLLGNSDGDPTINDALEALSESVDRNRPPPRPPRLCPGCSHRSAYYGIKREFRKRTLYPGDIGCYTLGVNLGAVDTCVDMGSGINLASGFYHAYKHGGQEKPIVASIGDSTLLHSGIPGLINAVTSGARFVLVILDNHTTAMTGFQPTPLNPEAHNGIDSGNVSIPELVKACGVRFVREADPYQHEEFRRVLKDAGRYTLEPEGGVAVVIAERPCRLHQPESVEPHPVLITDECDGCRYCLIAFECPALKLSVDESRVDLDETLCIDCGQCVDACHKGFIIPRSEERLWT
ncbi:MAG: thiamine pyrophosphate-dependent enzyme [Nitrospinaceae bacterium]|nr:thiamine pyrophosphate-dependent enzyme [Nitrospinaceae bacterium]MDP6734873.1 thiamine pyrophosphate-dependent enzyme [Nitrospinaceae bacterium]